MPVRNLSSMSKLAILIISASVLLMSTGCNGTPAAGSPNDSPSAAYKRLFTAVKSKETEAIKAEVTEKTVGFAQMVSAKQGTPIEKVFENGFTATTFASSMPNIRDERIDGDMGAVEVWNSKDTKWEDLPFIRENGAWKLAVGDLFAGSFKSPGPGRDQREKMAANALGNAAVPGSDGNFNANMPAGPPLPPKNADGGPAPKAPANAYKPK